MSKVRKPYLRPYLRPYYKTCQHKNRIFGFQSSRRALTASPRLPPPAGLEALPPSPSCTVLHELTNVMRRLSVDAFDLAHAPASKALAICDHSVFESSPWTVSTLNFTTDTAA